jgi:nucleoside-diphosphate-sugar epimerase
MKKVFITGISGLLGTNLAAELMDQDYLIKAIVRNTSKYKGKITSNLELIQMDLSGDFGEHLKETDIVIHIAAETSTNLIRYADYEKINYEATVRLFEIAKEQRVKQFIFISTANTIGYGSLKHLGTEAEKMKKPFSALHYAKSKLAAEKYLLKNQQGIDVKVLNPTFMIGPFDSKPSSGKIILMSLNKKLVFYPPGGKNFVPVKDVVSAIINSFHHGKSGEKYLISGNNLSYKEFFGKLKEITDEKQLLIPIPMPVLMTIGVFGNLMRQLNIKTSLSSANMKALCVKNYYSNQKSIHELKMTYTSLDFAMEEAVEYFEKT